MKEAALCTHPCLQRQDRKWGKALYEIRLAASSSLKPEPTSLKGASRNLVSISNVE